MPDVVGGLMSRRLDDAGYLVTYDPDCIPV
jgi:hypothetical protein